MDAFRALVVDKHGDQLMADIREVESVHLPEGDVTVDVAYSSLNYKDGLVLNGLGGLVKSYPHVPGIDYAGTVSYSTHPDFTRGDHVIGTGFRVGEVRWGGYAQRVSVSGDWLVSLPQRPQLIPRYVPRLSRPHCGNLPTHTRRTRTASQSRRGANYRRLWWRRLIRRISIGSSGLSSSRTYGTGRKPRLPATVGRKRDFTEI